MSEFSPLGAPSACHDFVRVTKLKPTFTVQSKRLEIVYPMLFDCFFSLRIRSMRTSRNRGACRQ
jgi:hypothetical protein